MNAQVDVQAIHDLYLNPDVSTFTSEDHIDQLNNQILSEEKAVNAFKRLSNLTPIPGQEFVVLVYFLTENITPEGSRGMVFPIGTFSRHKAAMKKVKYVMNVTGIKSVYVMPTCTWRDLDDKFDPDRTKYIDPKGQDDVLKKQHKLECDKLEQSHTEAKRVRKEIEQEQLSELKDDSLEAYIQLWFQRIQNEATTKSLEHQLTMERNKSETLNIKIRELYSKYPNYETEFIKQLKERLPKRGEEGLLDKIIQGHESIQYEVLNC